MGAAIDPAAVVDEQLRVIGIEGAAGCRLLNHANGRFGEYWRDGSNDRRKGRRHDPRPITAITQLEPRGSSSRSRLNPRQMLSLRLTIMTDLVTATHSNLKDASSQQGQ
jgi:hypothetical protein